MELLSQEMKKQMEKCKKQAWDAGLQFHENTLEYMVTNKDMLELRPKDMIPTLYDYWVQDVEVVRNKWTYDSYPHNPYETVVNTRPPISLYNQDNADWFNTMIFYHVLGHIDFFQNNIFFRGTWDDDFCGQALADKRLIERIRAELGEKKRWVDYVIEFALAIENLVGYHRGLREINRQESPEIFGVFSQRLDFYFGQFLKKRQEAGDIQIKFYYDELERYNRCVAKLGEQYGENAFFDDVEFQGRSPEFNDQFRRWKEGELKEKPQDIFDHLMENSEFLQKEDNKWMKDVLQVIRRTSIYFEPQKRTKIANEGWASFWHERLFIPDERIETHEVDYAIVDAGVTLDPRTGINPYALGKHLFQFIEHLATRGRLSPQYRLLQGIEERTNYDTRMGEGYAKRILLEARKYLDDYLLVNFLSDDDFQDFVDRYKLWVIGIRPSQERWDMAEAYIKSKNGRHYRNLVNKSLYHPPRIDFASGKEKNGELYLDHVYEGRTLHTPYVNSVLVGLEFLWEKPVNLETTEYEQVQPTNWWERQGEPTYRKLRVVYTCKNRTVTRTVIAGAPPAPVSDDY